MLKPLLNIISDGLLTNTVRHDFLGYDIEESTARKHEADATVVGKRCFVL